MGVAGSLDVGVWKVLLLDVRRPKLGKLKGIFFLQCFQCFPVLGVVSMLLPRPRYRLAGSARRDSDWQALPLLRPLCWLTGLSSAPATSPALLDC